MGIIVEWNFINQIWSLDEGQASIPVRDFLKSLGKGQNQTSFCFSFFEDFFTKIFNNGSHLGTVLCWVTLWTNIWYIEESLSGCIATRMIAMQPLRTHQNSRLFPLIFQNLQNCIKNVNLIIWIHFWESVFADFNQLIVTRARIIFNHMMEQFPGPFHYRKVNFSLGTNFKSSTPMETFRHFLNQWKFFFWMVAGWDANIQSTQCVGDFIKIPTLAECSCTWDYLCQSELNKIFWQNV